MVIQLIHDLPACNKCYELQVDERKNTFLNHYNNHVTLFYLRLTLNGESFLTLNLQISYQTEVISIS